jgi:energy-coupling factor transport system permease protein
VVDYYLYLDKNTLFHRLDPRTKIFILLGSFLLAILYQHPHYLLGILLLILTQAAIGRCLSNLRRLWLLLVLIFVFSVPIWAFYARGETPLLGRITAESLQYGIANALRIEAMLISGLVFLSTTKNEEIALGLIRLRLPYAMSFALSTALRLVPTFVETALTVMQAQQARGLELRAGGIRERVRKYIPLLGPVFLVTLRNANQLAMALESKGFGASKDRTFLLEIRFKRSDAIVLGLLILLLLFALYLRIQGKGQIPGLFL